MNDPRLNDLLQWGIRNSSVSQGATNENGQPQPPSSLNQEALAALLGMGGPSDAERMRDAMAAITSTEVDLDNKLVAFDNFEQLVENLDNANNMEPLGLWKPLIEQLEHDEAEMRRMAAWCLGTAVQNNPKAQERLLVMGAIPRLASMTTNDPHEPTRKKAILALSSQIRNYQPAMDAALPHIPEEFKPGDKVDAADMDTIDEMMQKLRDNSKKIAQ